MATKVKTLYGVEISLDPASGKFFATIDKRQHASKSLKTLETTIRKSATGVQVITLNMYSGRPENPDIVKVLRVDHSNLIGAGETRIWGTAYAYDEGLLEVLRSVHEEYKLARVDFEKRWEERWQNAKSELTLVDNQKIAEQLRLAEQQQSAD